MRRIALCLLLIGCEASPDPEVAADAIVDAAVPDAAQDAAPPAARLSVIDTLGFASETSPGVAPGFDVDGRVSDSHDAAGCFKSDQHAPDGTPGIDDALAKLVPLFAAAGIGAAESLTQSLIREGGLLLMIEIDGLDDPVDDDDVTMRIRAGAGDPLLGTDGLLLPGQTFDVHPDSAESVAEHARVVDGVLEAGPFESSLPILAFGMHYQLDLKNVHLRARLTPDGGLTDGVFGGGVPLDDLYAIGDIAARDDASVGRAIHTLFDSAGDLDPGPDGKCRQVSGAFTFTAVSAFLYPGQ